MAADAALAAVTTGTTSYAMPAAFSASMLSSARGSSASTTRIFKEVITAKVLIDLQDFYEVIGSIAFVRS